jgi:hypothetical protein
MVDFCELKNTEIYIGDISTDGSCGRVWHTFGDFGLILAAKYTIGAPATKSQYEDRKGGNGSINLTTALTDGVPTHGDVSLGFTLLFVPPAYDWEDKLIALRNICHGRQKRIWMPIDRQRYFLGQMEVGALDEDGNAIARLPVSAVCHATKYKNQVTQYIIDVPATGSVSARLENEGVRVWPKFSTEKTGDTTWSSVNIAYGGQTYAVSGENVQFEQIYLDAGYTDISVSGAASTTLTVAYQEAVL